MVTGKIKSIEYTKHFNYRKLGILTIIVCNNHIHVYQNQTSSDFRT